MQRKRKRKVIWTKSVKPEAVNTKRNNAIMKLMGMKFNAHHVTALLRKDYLVRRRQWVSHMFFRLCQLFFLTFHDVRSVFVNVQKILIKLRRVEFYLKFFDQRTKVGTNLFFNSRHKSTGKKLRQMRPYALGILSKILMFGHICSSQC